VRRQQQSVVGCRAHIHPLAVIARILSRRMSGLPGLAVTHQRGVEDVPQRGEFAAAVELRRRFPGITDNAQAWECARTIAGWKPLPLRPVKRMPKLPRLRRVR
jgi:hypothetical protein